MRKFEIPFNNDNNLVNRLAEETDFNDIYCIYMPPPISDNYHAVERGVLSKQQGLIQNYDEFAKSVKHINEVAPNKVQLLLQDTSRCMTEEQLKPLIDLGITKFCTSTLTQAGILRKIDKNFDISASVVADVDEDLLTFCLGYKQAFNNIVLPFRFCNNPDRVKHIKEMFPNYNYIMFCNTKCSIHCRSREHWNMEAKYLPMGGINLCPYDKDFNSALIDINNMPLYDDYIFAYKLVDRLYWTETIIKYYKQYR